jgi:RNA polymerase sigma factor (sigma-70 family)
LEDLTDEALVEQIRQGQNDAYRVLIERHKNYIFTLIFRMIEHRETAEDLTQEVFIKLHRSLHLFRGDAKFTTWLYRMTANIVTDYRRSKRRRPLEAVLDIVKGWFSDPDEQPEARTLRKEEHESIQELLRELPDKYRLVIYLYHYKQLSYQGIADVLQVPVKTVETRLYRGKMLLKQKWVEVYRNEWPLSQGSSASSDIK